MPLAHVNDAYTEHHDERLLDDDIAFTIERGGGEMPPAIVTGQNAADVRAYVSSVANP